MPYVKSLGNNLAFISKRLRDDPEIVLEAVKSNGYALAFASDRLKDNIEIVTEAINNYGRALEFASDRLRNDKELVLNAINQNPIFSSVTFNFAGDKIKEEFSTPEALLNSEKKITKDNPWSKGNEIDKANPWAEKTNSDKVSDLER